MYQCKTGFILTDNFRFLMDKISIGVQLSSWVHSLPAYYKMTKSWQISRQKPVPDHFSIKQWTKDLLLADIYFSIERHFWSLQLFWQKWLAFCMYNLWPHYIHHTTLHYTTLHNTIGQFSEAGLHEWMLFVIFRARSRERSQRHFRADFWVGVASRCV